MRTVSDKLPRDFREILSWWSTTRELAEALDISDSTVRQWKLRNSIPANFWAALCETAIAERNDLTTRKLALLIDFRKHLKNPIAMRALFEPLAKRFDAFAARL